MSSIRDNETKTKTQMRIRMRESDKSIVIPYVRHNHKISFCMVLDSKSKDWTFVVGGCKKNGETIYECANRELQEETFGTIKMDQNEPKLIEYTGNQTYKMNMSRQKNEVQHKFYIFLFELKDSVATTTQTYFYNKNEILNSRIDDMETSGITFIPFDLLKNKAFREEIKVYHLMHGIIDHISQQDLFEKRGNSPSIKSKNTIANTPSTQFTRTKTKTKPSVSVNRINTPSLIPSKSTYIPPHLREK